MLIIHINCQNITHNHKWLPYYTHLVIDQVNITLAPHVGNMHICHQFLADMACRCDTEESTTCPIYENGFARASGVAGGTCECRLSVGDVTGPSPFLCFLQEKFFGE